MGCVGAKLTTEDHHYNLSIDLVANCAQVVQMFIELWE